MLCRWRITYVYYLLYLVLNFITSDFIVFILGQLSTNRHITCRYSSVLRTLQDAGQSVRRTILYEVRDEVAYTYVCSFPGRVIVGKLTFL